MRCGHRHEQRASVSRSIEAQPSAAAQEYMPMNVLARGLACLFALLSIDAVAVDDATNSLAQECLACHNAQNTRGALPMLEGQNPRYLERQLQAFAERHREAFPMNIIAAGLRPEEARNLSDYLGSRTWLDFPARTADARVERGRALAERYACANCHGPAFLGTDVIPRLAGQNPVYLARQLGAFGANDRYHPPTGTGARMYTLEPGEAEALAAFLNSLRDAGR
jgi:cytochrome c553